MMNTVSFGLRTLHCGKHSENIARISFNKKKHCKHSVGKFQIDPILRHGSRKFDYNIENSNTKYILSGISILVSLNLKFGELSSASKK